MTVHARCRWLLMMLILAGVAAFAEEPRVTRITTLRPAPDAEVIRDFLVVETSDGQKSVRSAPREADVAARPADRAYTWTVDLKRGTYSTRRSELTAADRAMRERARGRVAGAAGRRFDVGAECEEFQTSDDWIPCNGDNSGTGWRYAIAHETWQPNSVYGSSAATRTELNVDWKSCHGRLELESFSGQCYTPAFNTWRYVSCGRQPPYPTSFGILDATVIGNYQNYTLGDPAVATNVSEQVEFEGSVDGGWGTSSFLVYGEMAGFLTGRQYESGPHPYYAYCDSYGGGGGGGGGGSTPGGGDGGGGGGGTGGGSYCVPVYDGESGEKLGDCCGTSNTEIVNCAKQYIS